MIEEYFRKGFTENDNDEADSIFAYITTTMVSFFITLLVLIILEESGVGITGKILTTMIIFFVGTLMAITIQVERYCSSNNIWKGIRYISLPIQGFIISILTLHEKTFNTITIILTLILITEIIYLYVLKNKPKDRKELFWHVAKQKLLSLYLAYPITFAGWYIIDHTDNILRNKELLIKIIPIIGTCMIWLAKAILIILAIIAIITAITGIIYLYIRINTLKYKKAPRTKRKRTKEG